MAAGVNYTITATYFATDAYGNTGPEISERVFPNIAEGDICLVLRNLSEDISNVVLAMDIASVKVDVRRNPDQIDGTA